jgi:SnoaL-like domain
MNDKDSGVVAITQLMNLYGLAVDSQRWKLFDRIFTADVDADYGATSHWADREQLKADAVHVDGDRAYSFCNGGWRLVRGAADGDPRWDGTGWYDDTLMRTPSG